MLAKARAKVAEEGLANVAALRRMDARALDFPDASFDHVACMHVISVVPEPERVMAEIARVVRPGGTVVIVNHFRRDKGALALAERLAAPLADLLGWHSDFPKDPVLSCRGARGGRGTRRARRMGMFTRLRLRKRAEA